MRIFVKVKTRSKVQRVEKLDEDHYVVSVKEPPVEGRANEAVVAAFAGYFAVPQGRIRLISGRTNREKIFEITTS